ncbi:hypothetical protein [Fulvitalea axinellae]
MKKVVLLFVAFLGFTVFGVGQSIPETGSTEQEREVVRAIFNMAKKEFFIANMDLDKSQADIFWPIYDEYSAKKTKYTNGQVERLRKLVSQEDFASKEVEGIIKAINETEVKNSKLRYQYYQKIHKKVDLITAVQFFQLDELVQSEVKAFMMQNMKPIRRLKP